MRYKVVFSYDGSLFYGYQCQSGTGKRTVQGEMEKAISYLNRQTKTEIVSSGRTDRGVHAIRQVGHFDLSIPIPCYKIKRGLNSLLPEDIHVISVEEVEDDFHARYMVSSKKYIYKVNIGEYNPLMRNYCYQLGKELNVSLMKKVSSLLVGRHDFRSFVDSEDTRENTVREIFSIDIKKNGDIIEFSFVGDGFMKYQVRNMVGALILVGLHKKTKEEFQDLFLKKSRKKAWKAAPACGLYLEEVNY